MSEFNVALPPSGFVSVEKENSLSDPISINSTMSPKQAHQEPEEDVEKVSPLTPTEITETVEEVNSFLQNMQRNLSFTVDEQLGQSVILVKDSESDEVIRQIPSEELVVLRKKMDDVVGILFDTKV